MSFQKTRSPTASTRAGGRLRPPLCAGMPNVCIPEACHSEIASETGASSCGFFTPGAADLIVSVSAIATSWLVVFWPAVAGDCRLGVLESSQVMEDVLAAVVPDHVEASFREQDLGEIAVGGDESFLTAKRPRDHLAVPGLDDGGTALLERILTFGELKWKVVGKRAARDEVRDGDHERAGFDRDMPHRRDPLLRVIGGRSHPDLRSLAIQRVPGQGHPVLVT